MVKIKLIPSKREIASIVLLVVALICYINNTQWSNIGFFPDDPNIFILYPKIGIAGIMNLLFGLSTWLFHSFNRLTKLCMRLFVIIYLIWTGMDIMAASAAARGPYDENANVLFENIERDCWDDEFFSELDMAILMTQVAAIIMYVAAGILVFLELRGCLYLVRNFAYARQERRARQNPA